MLKTRFYRTLRVIVDVDDREIGCLLWAFGYFFLLLCAYSILRPVRDAMAIEGGVGDLPWLFTATFLVMLGAVPLFGALVSRFSPGRFIPLIYWFFIANLALFWGLLQYDGVRVFAAPAFFVWISVFNLFVVSVFWSFMLDLFREAQGRRLFGFIAAGGTTGTIAGPAVSLAATKLMPAAHLLLISAVLLALALVCVARLRALGQNPPDEHARARPDQSRPLDQPGGGGLFAGFTDIVKSPYLSGVALFVALFTTTSTFLYFQQADIVHRTVSGTAGRIGLFAAIDLAVAVLTVLVQLSLTGRFFKRFGVAAAAAFLPLVTLIGFCLLAAAPVLGVLVGFQIIRRMSNFAITRPARELLFGVVPRAQKYKSKNFIDTVIYRGGDAVSGWAYAGLSRALALETGIIALIGAGIAAGWMALAWALGRRQMQRADDDDGQVYGRTGELGTRMMR